MTKPAVVVVSGGAAISPFTTPTAACGSGQPAGSTDSYLRATLLEAGYSVYTSPANAGPEQAVSDTGFAGFSDPPELLSTAVTVNSVGGIDAAGHNLAAFLQLLTRRYGHDRVHLVAHSMGGLFSLAAINQLSESGPQVVSLTTIGTPWRGGFAADYAAGDLALSDAGGDSGFESVLTTFAAEVAALPAGNAGQQVAGRFVNDWVPTRAAALQELPVTLIAGDAFTGTGPMWPNDGLVTLASALAEGVSASALASAPRHTFSDAHSIYFADLFGLPWERALTWDPAVAKVVMTALAAQE
jgi:triacylglycerol lipase